MSFAPRNKKMDPRPTRRQAQILDFINAFVYTHKFPPSIREIGNGVNLASSSTVHSHLSSLERKGLINRNQNHPRSITVIGNRAQADAALLAALSHWSEFYGATAPELAATVQAFTNLVKREAD